MGLGLEPDRPTRDLPAELRDTYECGTLPRGLRVVWLDEQGFHAQPSDVRAGLVRAQVRHGRGAVPAISDWVDILDAQVLHELADGHRFVWWPGLVEPHRDAVLTRVVSDGQLPCQRVGAGGDLACGRVRTSPCPRTQRNLRQREQRGLGWANGAPGRGDCVDDLAPTCRVLQRTGGQGVRSDTLRLTSRQASSLAASSCAACCASGTASAPSSRRTGASSWPARACTTWATRRGFVRS